MKWQVLAHTVSADTLDGIESALGLPLDLVLPTPTGTRPWVVVAAVVAVACGGVFLRQPRIFILLSFAAAVPVPVPDGPPVPV